MIDTIVLEVPKRHALDHMRCICRLQVNGERRGKLSLTKSEALTLASVMTEGVKSKAHMKFSITLAEVA